MRQQKLIKVFGMVAATAVMFLLVAAVVMWLWNMLLPGIIGVQPVSYFQAAGILVLSKILFGGFCPGRRRGFCRGGHDTFWEKMHSRQGFSPEEKAELREKFRERFMNSDFCRRWGKDSGNQ
ncbi:hypothetical protein AAH994_08145 [Weeksellaceae bacterium A-14]|uniref:hypothetical protein n=1 Tax=Daejeonia sp. YH14 TaxID=3439042 RepID=UPI0031E4B347